MNSPYEGAALAQAAGVTHLPVSALLTLPTGAGKTWLALQAAREALIGGGRVLVLVPLKVLCRGSCGDMGRGAARLRCTARHRQYPEPHRIP